MTLGYSYSVSITTKGSTQEARYVAQAATTTTTLVESTSDSIRFSSDSRPILVRFLVSPKRRFRISRINSSTGKGHTMLIKTLHPRDFHPSRPCPHHPTNSTLPNSIRPMGIHRRRVKRWCDVEGIGHHDLAHAQPSDERSEGPERPRPPRISPPL